MGFLAGQTLVFSFPMKVLASGSIVGKREKQGPLGPYFQQVMEKDDLGEKCWEKAERRMTERAIHTALANGNLSKQDIDLIIGGDLLNQIITANFIAAKFDSPFFGIYGACSTFVEGLILASTAIEGGYGEKVLVFTSSHYQTAERQYRTPLEYGDQYPPYKQWTVTGAGAVVVGKQGQGVQITHATPGKVMDWGQKDPNDLGCAMAPAAAETILQHLKDLRIDFKDYDLVLTGDLGKEGLKIVRKLLNQEGIDPGDKLNDCGAMVYSSKQKVGAGGSGCAASAVVFDSYLVPGLLQGRFKKVLLIATGALFSPLTYNQGETIPCVAHAIALSAPGQEG